MVKYLIFGDGWLGNKFKKYLKDSFISSADITNHADVWEALVGSKPEIAINCAGKTGKPNVDWCEDHKIETLRSNVEGPINLAETCLKYGVYLAHIGSGCVYEGDNNGRGFSEDDQPNYFGSFYSITKMVSESALKNLPVLQMRIRMPVDSKPSERSLIDKLVKYKKIINPANSITAIPDFLEAAEKLMGKKCTGIYNLVNPNAITNQEIVELYKKIINPDYSYEIISLDQLYNSGKVKAKRSSCVLRTKKLEAEGIVMPEIHTAVEKCLHEYKKYL